MRPARDKRELADRSRQMLAMHAQGMTLREIAAAFGVSAVRVHEICHREERRQECEAHLTQVT